MTAHSQEVTQAKRPWLKQNRARKTCERQTEHHVRPPHRPPRDVSRRANTNARFQFSGTRNMTRVH